jgi:hypothetical protein
MPLLLSSSENIIAVDKTSSQQNGVAPSSLFIMSFLFSFVAVKNVNMSIIAFVFNKLLTLWVGMHL